MQKENPNVIKIRSKLTYDCLVQNAPGSPKQYPEGRVCECGTILSRYDGNKVCAGCRTNWRKYV